MSYMVKSRGKSNLSILLGDFFMRLIYSSSLPTPARRDDSYSFGGSYSDDDGFRSDHPLGGGAMMGVGGGAMMGGGVGGGSGPIVAGISAPAQGGIF